MKKIISLFFLLFITTACQAEVVTPAAATMIPSSTPPVFITATLPITPIPYASPTLPFAPSATPNKPIEGQTTAQVNIRQAPASSSQQIGTIEIFAKVQIVGKNPEESWWMIVFPEKSNGEGWVSAEFIQVEENTDAVPVIATQPPAEENASTTEVSSNTGEPTLPTIQPTSALAIAPDDGDSAQNPAIQLTLGKDSYIHLVNEISSPTGDAEDWVKFYLDGGAGQEKIIAVTIECSGSPYVNLALLQNEFPLQKWDNLTCGQRRQLQLYLYVGAPYYLQISALDKAALSYVSYTLTVQLME